MENETPTTTVDLEWYGQWNHAWERDDPYRNDCDVYFNRDTCSLLFVDTEDSLSLDDVREVLANPHQYEKIPVLAHAEHHRIFADWIATLPQKIQDLCNAEEWLRDRGIELRSWL